jgi:hypothetical protein
LAIASVIFFCVVSQASAQSAPPHVEKAVAKLIGEWTAESNIDGEIFRWEVSIKPSPNGKSILYFWKGTDIVSGQESSGTGIIGWDAGKQLPYEVDLEADGAVYRSTHRITESGEWTSATEGTSVVDGKPVHVESYRVFKFKSNDEFTVIEGHRVIDGKPASDAVSVFKRK